MYWNLQPQHGMSALPGAICSVMHQDQPACASVRSWVQASYSGWEQRGILIGLGLFKNTKMAFGGPGVRWWAWCIDGCISRYSSGCWLAGYLFFRTFFPGARQLHLSHFSCWEVCICVSGGTRWYCWQCNPHSVWICCQSLCQALAQLLCSVPYEMVSASKHVYKARSHRQTRQIAEAGMSCQ